VKKLIGYPFEVKPLIHDDGGGFLISYPDFAECISDGETVGEAIANGADALQATIATLKADELPVPQPGSGDVATGKFVTCIGISTKT
jgi:antitoxin HicB